MPLNTIDITRGQDIQLPDEPSRMDYRGKVQANDIVGARDIVNSDPGLFSKVLTPSLVNEVADGITTMQEKYDEDFTQHMASLIEEWNLYVSDFDMVEWSPSTQYKERNFVTYDGEVYLCIGETSGIIPPDDTNWILVGLRGEDGAVGLGVNYRGEWTAPGTYEKYDMVVLLNKLYVAITSSVGLSPKDNPAEWFMAMDGDDNIGIIVSRDEPSRVYDGVFWWNIIPDPATWGGLSAYTYEFLGGFTYEEIMRGMI